MALSGEIRRNAVAFQTVDLTAYSLQSLREVFPELVDVALARLPVERLCLVLRSLLDEEISIRNLKAILEALLAVNGTMDADLNRYIVFTPYATQLCPVGEGVTLADLTVTDYANVVRASLKRYISNKYTRGGNTLTVYLLDREIEARIAEAADRPLSADEKAQFTQAVKAELEKLPATAPRPVRLTTTDLRRATRDLVHADLPHLGVLSYQELSPELKIQPLARISWRK